MRELCYANCNFFLEKSGTCICNNVKQFGTLCSDKYLQLLMTETAHAHAYYYVVGQDSGLNWY